MTATHESRAETADLARAVDEMVAAVYVADAAQRYVAEPVLDRAAWSRMGSELDLIGLHLPADVGGQGQSFGVHASVVSALGRRLTPAPHLSVLGLALTLLGHGTTSTQRDRWLPDVLAGRTVVAVAGLDRGWDDPSGQAPEVALVAGADGPTLRGSTTPVVHGADADLLLVVLDGRVLAVDPAATGVRVEPLETLDLTRPRAVVHLDGAPAEELGAVGPELLRVAVEQATVLHAVEAVASARTCLTRTVEYATIRTQFDRPIGSFQAVQHALADLFGEVSAAEAAVAVAVDALEGGDAGSRAVTETVRVAKVSAAEAFCRASRDSIHLHGGIGFTWEHDAHLFYRRALTDRPFLGDPSSHRRALARGLVATV